LKGRKYVSCSICDPLSIFMSKRGRQYERKTFQQKFKKKFVQKLLTCFGTKFWSENKRTFFTNYFEINQFRMTHFSLIKNILFDKMEFLSQSCSTFSTFSQLRPHWLWKILKSDAHYSSKFLADCLFPKCFIQMCHWFT